MPIWIEYTICRSCEYKSTASADCCISCGSLDTYKDTVVFEGDDNE